MSRRAAIAVVLVLAACGGRRVPADAIKPQAAWETKAGKQQAQLDIAQALVKAGNHQQALIYVSQLRTAGNADPVQLDVIQAEAMQGLGLYDDAERILLDVVHKHRRNAEAWALLGVLRMDMGQVEDAIAAFEVAVDVQPERADLLNNLGFAYMSAARYDDAVKALRASLKLDGSQSRTRNNLGFALIAAGNEGEAFRVFRASLPEADAQYNLGLGLELRGDPDDAAEAYRAAVAKNPQHLKALTRLSALSEAAVSASKQSTHPPPSIGDALEVQ